MLEEELILLPLKSIVNIDKVYSYGKMIRPIESIYSSYFYYETLEEQITSIFLNIIKGHYFSDGNKRTACNVLICLCKLNQVKYKFNDNNLYKKAIEIASNKLSVEEAKKMLF